MAIEKSEKFRFKSHDSNSGGRHDSAIRRRPSRVQVEVETTEAQAAEVTVAEVPTAGVAEYEAVRPAPYEPVLVEPKYVPEQIKSEHVETMETGMRLLLEYMPEDTRELVTEFCRDSGVALWQAIGGYVLRAREAALLMNPLVLPEWEDMIPASADRACGTCGDPIKPTTWSQKFCCNPCYFGKVAERGHAADCARHSEVAA